MKFKQNRKARTKLQQQKDHAMNLLLLKIAIIAVATTIVVYCLPRLGEFNYSYELGQPWHYGTMISTQKFNIQMSDSTLGMKRDSLARSFMPYFTRNMQLESNVKERLKLLDADGELKNYVVTLLDSVYKKGVMLGTTYDSLQNLGTSYIRIIQGNEAKIVPFDRVLSLHEAYQFIVSHNKTGFTNRDIRTLNIYTLLAENLIYEPMKSEEELQAAYVHRVLVISQRCAGARDNERRSKKKQAVQASYFGDKSEWFWGFSCYSWAICQYSVQIT